MSTLLDDPLYQAQHQAGMDILGLYNPAQETQRHDRALGQLRQTVAERQARAGLTGSSEEQDALTNAATNFELGWSERQPTQITQAIQASQLPIGNLLSSQLGNRRLDLTERDQDFTRLSSLAGGAGSLANWLFGNGGSNLSGLVGGATSGGKALYDALFSGGSNGNYQDFSDIPQNVLDWWDPGGANGIPWGEPVNAGDLGGSLADIGSDIYDWWTW